MVHVMIMGDSHYTRIEGIDVYDVLILSVNQKESTEIWVDGITVRALNSKGETRP